MNKFTNKNLSKKSLNGSCSMDCTIRHRPLRVRALNNSAKSIVIFVYEKQIELVLKIDMEMIRSESCLRWKKTTVSLISGNAFQRRKPREGFRRSNAAVESICSAKGDEELSTGAHISYCFRWNQGQVEVAFAWLCQIEVYPKEWSRPVHLLVDGCYYLITNRSFSCCFCFRSESFLYREAWLVRMGGWCDRLYSRFYRTWHRRMSVRDVWVKFQWLFVEMSEYWRMLKKKRIVLFWWSDAQRKLTITFSLLFDSSSDTSW